jgi:hypothetical protein
MVKRKPPDGPDLFGYTSARAERDRGMARVGANNVEWMIQGLRLMPRLKDRFHNGATGEEIRLALTPVIGLPTHHNAWGRLIRLAIEQNILVMTGAMDQMRTPKSHARSTPVYVFR